MRTPTFFDSPALRIAISSVLLIAALASAGCSGGGSSSNASTAPSSPAADTPAPGGGSGGTGPAPGGAAAAPVVYLADQEIYERYELFMADGAGGSVKVSGALVGGGAVDEFVMTSDHSAVIYTADADYDNRRELYRVDLSQPGVATKLNTPLTINRDVLDFAVSADGARVLYRADQDANGVFELYLVNVANPGAAVKVNGALTANGWVRSGFTFSPDGSRIVYRADEQTFDEVELFMVDPAQPGASQKLNSTLVQEGDVAEGVKFSPDGATVGYVADQEVDGVLELFAVDVSAPGVVHKLNGPLIAGGNVCQFRFSPDSTRVAYCADQELDDVEELFTTALSSPGQSVKLNPPLVADGDVTTGYEFAPDSSFIVYAARQDAPTTTELYRVDIASPGFATRLNAPQLAGGGLVGHHLRPDGARVAYIANQENAQVYELYEVDLQTPGVATKLSAPMNSSGLFNFRYAADGTKVVYLADQDSDAAELYEVETAAPGVATRLNSALVALGEVWDYALTF